MGMNSAPKPRPTIATRIFLSAAIAEVLSGEVGSWDASGYRIVESCGKGKMLAPRPRHGQAGRDFSAGCSCRDSCSGVRGGKSLIVLLTILISGAKVAR